MAKRERQNAHKDQSLSLAGVNQNCKHEVLTTPMTLIKQFNEWSNKQLVDTTQLPSIVIRPVQYKKH